MADDKKEKWMNYMAITTVLIAVCATFSTFKGGGYSTKSLLNQTLASDQWAFFEAKSLKSYIFEMQKDNLELQMGMISKSPASQDMLDKYQKKVDVYSKKLKQYEEDKADIKKTANGFEAERDDCKKHSSAFGIAVIFLQISILLSSISALAKKHYIYYLSLIVGAAGVVYFFDGFFLFLK
jgi:hypothetical protein